MDVVARIRAEVGYEPESGEAYGFDVIERYMDALEAHARAMEMLGVPSQPRGAVEALREAWEANRDDPDCASAEICRKALVAMGVNLNHQPGAVGP